MNKEDIKCFFPEGYKTQTQTQSNGQNQQDDLVNKIKTLLTTFRVDIKNIGSENNSVSVTADNSKITTPTWFKNDQGQGVVIEGSNLTQKIIIKAQQDGKLTFGFRGQDKRFENNRFPVWIDYKSIKIDGKEILSIPLATWHDKPFKYEIPVKDGQEIIVEFEQQYHQYTLDELKDTILKLTPDNKEVKDNITDIITNLSTIMGFKDTKPTWDIVKNQILTQEPKQITLDEIDETISGRLQIKMGTTQFETVLIPSNHKKLYISLGGYNNKDLTTQLYPTFSRISWFDKFDGIYVCFDDPTRIEKNLSPSYYFGKKDENYLDYLYDIILKIAQSNKISNENIFIIGSSHTGFCSLYLADKIINSNAIALCPQIDVKLLKGEQFSNIMDISYDNPQYFERLNVLRILKNTKSHFFIFSNILCNHDKSQMDLLFLTANQTPQIGLTQLTQNIKVLLADIPAKSPHHAQPDEFFCSQIEKLINKPITKETEDLCNAFIGNMKKYWWLHKQHEDLKESLTQETKN